MSCLEYDDEDEQNENKKDNSDCTPYDINILALFPVQWATQNQAYHAA